MQKIFILLICLVIIIFILPNLSFAGMRGGYACVGMMHGGFMGMGNEKEEHLGDRSHRTNVMPHQEHVKMMDQIMRDSSMHNELMKRMMGDHRFMKKKMGQVVRDAKVMDQMLGRWI